MYKSLKIRSSRKKPSGHAPFAPRSSCQPSRPCPCWEPDRTDFSKRAACPLALGQPPHPGRRSPGMDVLPSVPSPLTCFLSVASADGLVGPEEKRWKVRTQGKRCKAWAWGDRDWERESRRFQKHTKPNSVLQRQWMPKGAQKMYVYIWPWVTNMEIISLSIFFQLLSSGTPSW